MTERVKIYSNEWISLVIPEKQDHEAWYRWISNPEVNQYMWDAIVWKLQSKESSEERYAQINSQDDAIFFWMYDDEKKKYLGNICLADIDYKARKAELGIVIFDLENTSKWVWTKSIKMLLKHAFEVLWLNKIYFEVLGTNVRAIKCYEKCWFKEVWRLKDHHYRMWKYHDLVWMEMFNEKMVD